MYEWLRTIMSGSYFAYRVVHYYDWIWRNIKVRRYEKAYRDNMYTYIYIYLFRDMQYIDIFGI